MGVLGLWQLLSPIGQPVTLESLENKILAVDISIWLNQAIKGYRDSKGASVPNAHLLSLYSRLCKLLFYKIRPIIVFDGGVPELKRQTIISRHERRTALKDTSRDANLKLLANYLASQNVQNHANVNFKPSTSSKAKIQDDIFVLPPLPQITESQEDMHDNDLDMKHESFSYSDLKYLNDIDIESEEFSALPSDIKQEILSNLKESRRYHRWEYYENLPKESNEFSNFQMKSLLKRRKLQSKLEEVQRDMQQSRYSDIISMYANDHMVCEPSKIMSDECAHYVLMKKTTSNVPEKPKVEDCSTVLQPAKSESNVLINPAHLWNDEFPVALGVMSDEDTDQNEDNVKAEITESASCEPTCSSLPQTVESSSVPSSSCYVDDNCLKYNIEESASSSGCKADCKDIANTNSLDELTFPLAADKVELRSTASVYPLKPESSKSSDLIDLGCCMQQHDSESPIKLFADTAEKEQKSKTLTKITDPKTILRISKICTPINPELGSIDDNARSNKCIDTMLSSSRNVFIDEEVDFGLDLNKLENNSSIVEKSGSEKTPEVVKLSLEVQRELEMVQQHLQSEKTKHERQASTVHEHMVEECKDMLKLFGVPYVVSPMEAEAQCAFYDLKEISHGTITDDSDIWLFGGKRVYKNFFAQQKYVEFYKDQEILSHFGMDRIRLINFAMLTGSDYTEGIEGVGPVTAMEIISEFQANGIEGLKDLKAWWVESKNHATIPKNKIRAKLKKLTIPESFPNTIVIDTYLDPEVDNCTESFSWGLPDLDALRDYAKQKFGWNKAKVDESLLPVVKRLNERTHQMHLDSFFSITLKKEKNLFPSKRITSALKKINHAPHDECDDPSPPKCKKTSRSKKMKQNKQKTVTKNTMKNQKSPSNKTIKNTLQLSEESSSDDM